MHLKDYFNEIIKHENIFQILSAYCDLQTGN